MQKKERYRVKPAFALSKDGFTGERLVGQVVWVHPKRRFAVLAFGGGVRECFYPEQLTADKLVTGKRGGRR